MSTIDKLDPELDALLDVERARTEQMPDEVRAAGAEALAKRIALEGSADASQAEEPSVASGDPTSTGAGRLTPWKLLSVALVSGALGFAGGRLTAPEPQAAPSPAIASPTQVASTAITHAAPPVESAAIRVDSLPSASAPVSAPSRASAAPGAPSPGETTREQTLVERAREAIARRDFVSARRALAEHARDYPRGALAEEREMLEVMVLAQSGDGQGARAHGAAFLQRYPKSVFASRVRKAAGID